jgi:hypothetical protein
LDDPGPVGTKGMSQLKKCIFPNPKA